MEMMRVVVFMKKCLAALLVLALCLIYVPGVSAAELDQAGAGQMSDSFDEADVSADDQSPDVVPDTEPDEPSPEPDEPTPKPAQFYSDVAKNRWSYNSIRALFDLGIAPSRDRFEPEAGCTRLDFVNMLYKCHLSICGEQGDGEVGPQTSDTETDEPRFTDVLPGSEGYDAVIWAVENSVSEGISDTEFGRDKVLSRQEGAVFVIRMAHACGISLPKAADMTLFRDAASISAFARSSVMACQMAKLLSGKGEGTFAPNSDITNEEAATLVYRLYGAVVKDPISGEEMISTEPDAYLDEFNQKLFFMEVPESSWAYQYI